MADPPDESINELSNEIAKLEIKIENLEDEISNVETTLRETDDEEEKGYLREKAKQLRARVHQLGEEKKSLRDEKKQLREEKAKQLKLAAAAAASTAATTQNGGGTTTNANNDNFSNGDVMGARILAQYQHLTQMIAQSNLNRDTNNLQMKTYLENQFTMLRNMRGGPMPMPPPRMGMNMMMPMARFGVPGAGASIQANGNNGQQQKKDQPNGEPQKKKARRLGSGDTGDGPKLQEYKDVASAWKEWTEGLGGYKAVKEWVPAEYKGQKSTYSRRRPLWVLMQNLVDSGRNPDWVIKRIEEIYGPDIRSIRWLCAKIKEDETNGTLHEDLKV